MPKDTNVMIFGAKNYETKQGFIIIRKKDDVDMTIQDLEDFPPKTWVTREDKEGINGAFTVYYQPCENFKDNIDSVK